jgi:hypothetical protein
MQCPMQMQGLQSQLDGAKMWPHRTGVGRAAAAAGDDKQGCFSDAVDALLPKFDPRSATIDWRNGDARL